VAEPDELTLTIARQLEVDYQFTERVEAWNADRIAELRSAGRKAGRLLGLRIMTHQTDPNSEGRVLVIVAVRDWPSEEERERMLERGALLMNEAFKSLWPKHESPGS
jgi:hypothetical protein